MGKLIKQYTLLSQWLLVVSTMTSSWIGYWEWGLEGWHLAGSYTFSMDAFREFSLGRNVWPHGPLVVGCTWDWLSPQCFWTSTVCEAAGRGHLDIWGVLPSVCWWHTTLSLLFIFCTWCPLSPGALLATILEWMKTNRLELSVGAPTRQVSLVVLSLSWMESLSS